MKHAFTALLPVALMAAGCAIVGPSDLGTGHASLVLQPQVQSASYRTQATVGSYTQADINHVQLKLFKVVSGSEVAVTSGGSPLTLDLPQASLSTLVTIGNLNKGTVYRVRAYAYADSGTSTKLSLDASSSVDITVSDDDRPTAGTIPVQLIDRAFTGQATSSLTVTPGNVTHTGTESLSAGS